MLLKLKRSQRTGGLTGSVAIFILDARVDLSAKEQSDVKRYKLGSQVIYTSDAREKAAAGAALAAGRAGGPISLHNMDTIVGGAAGALGHGLKAAALAGIAHLNLKITITSLTDGHHIECKSLDELLGAEEAILMACENLNGYLLTAATFDGREQVIEYSDRGKVTVASAAIAPALVQAPEAALPPPMPPVSQPEPEPRTIPATISAAPKVYAPATQGPVGALIDDVVGMANDLGLRDPGPGARAALFVCAVPVTALTSNWIFHSWPLLTVLLTVGVIFLAVRAVGEVL